MFDDEAGVFHGEVINTRDVITFQGTTVDEIQKAVLIAKEKGESLNSWIVKTVKKAVNG